MAVEGAEILYPEVLIIDDRPDMELYRTGSRDDAAEIQALIAPNWDYLTEFNYLGEAEPSISAVRAATAETVQGMIAGREVQYLARAADSLVGRVGLTSINARQRTARLSYWLGAQFQGHGYAQSAAGRLVQFGFEEVGLERILIGVEPQNAKSEHVAQKLGAHLTHHVDIETHRGRSINFGRWEIGR